MLRTAAAATIVAFMATVAHDAPTAAGSGDHRVVRVASPAPPAAAPAKALSPEEKMQRRYPQPVKVGDLIGLPMLDDDDRTLGRVTSVVRTASGRILLIVPYRGFLGVPPRLVAVPIEVVAIAGRQLAALDMPRAEFDAAPAWDDPHSRPIPATEMIRIGLYRR